MGSLFPLTELPASFSTQTFPARSCALSWLFHGNLDTFPTCPEHEQAVLGEAKPGGKRLSGNGAFQVPMVAGSKDKAVNSWGPQWDWGKPKAALRGSSCGNSEGRTEPHLCQQWGRCGGKAPPEECAAGPASGAGAQEILWDLPQLSPRSWHCSGWECPARQHSSHSLRSFPGDPQALERSHHTFQRSLHNFHIPLCPCTGHPGDTYRGCSCPRGWLCSRWIFSRWTRSQSSSRGLWRRYSLFAHIYSRFGEKSFVEGLSSPKRLPQGRGRVHMTGSVPEMCGCGTVKGDLAGTRLDLMISEGFNSIIPGSGCVTCSEGHQDWLD